MAGGRPTTPGLLRRPLQAVAAAVSRTTPATLAKTSPSTLAVTAAVASEFSLALNHSDILLTLLRLAAAPRATSLAIVSRRRRRASTPAFATTAMSLATTPPTAPTKGSSASSLASAMAVASLATARPIVLTRLRRPVVSARPRVTSLLTAMPTVSSPSTVSYATSLLKKLGRLSRPPTRIRRPSPLSR